MTFFTTNLKIILRRSQTRIVIQLIEINATLCYFTEHVIVLAHNILHYIIITKQYGNLHKVWVQFVMCNKHGHSINILYSFKQ